MHVRTRKYTTLHLNCLRKLLKIRRQYKMPDTAVPKKTTKQRAHAVESSQRLHPIAILNDGRMRNYQRKGLMVNIRSKSVSNVAEERLNFTLITSLIELNIPIYSCEWTAQVGAKCCRLDIRIGAVSIKKKTVCEAERKRTEHKVRSKEQS